MRLVHSVSVVIAAMGLATAAFATDPASPGSTPTDTTATAGASTAPKMSYESITDAQIIGILDTVNLGEIDEGKLMVAKTTNPEVKKHAQMMIDEHTAMTKRAAEMAKKAKVTAADSKTRTELQTHMKESMAEMKGEAAAQADRHYIDHSVMAHQQVLDMIDGQLIPNAKHADVKALLAEARPKVAMHLEDAKRIQASMGGGAATTGAGATGTTGGTTGTGTGSTATGGTSGTGSGAQGSPPSPMPTPTGPSSPAPMPSPSPSPKPSPTPSPAPSPTPLPGGSTN